ncbi:hypothetical protein KBC54_02325 [Patescibacteria group bacterium]|nr:hypothetical protein [Patescibacteria group bacterium]
METPPKAGPDTKQTREDEEDALDLLHRWPTQNEPLDPVLLVNPEGAFQGVEMGIENLERPNTDVEDRIVERLRLRRLQEEESRIAPERIEELQGLIDQGVDVVAAGVPEVSPDQNLTGRNRTVALNRRDMETFGAVIGGEQAGLATRGEVVRGGEMPAGMTTELSGSGGSTMSVQGIEGVGETDVQPAMFNLAELQRQDEERQRRAGGNRTNAA